ncbi:hypothetical protein FQN57_001913 [Myotisia sp. PD_48]|nr:hypothetical protein FQN57_001913 [Myotisia sp. PD_48]
MTSDDEFFFDYLAWVPNDVKKYSAQITNSIEHHVDSLASSLRDTLSQQSWVPKTVKPLRRPPAPELPQPPQSLISSVQDWISRHRALTAAFIAFIGTGGVLLYGNSQFRAKKRKARRAANGARKEIVVIAGSALEPMTRSIALDLERRGYIVFITASSAEEEHVIENEAREDIRPLWFDVSHTPATPSEIHPSLYVIQSLITNPQSPSPGIPAHLCQLSGLILVPSLDYPTGPVATIPAASWADTINTRLLYPILATQYFLPLLTMKRTNSTIVLVSPSIQSALSAPFAAPEVATTHALSGFATSLRQELRLLEHSDGGNVEVVEIKVGNIDFGRQLRGSHKNKGTEVLTWQPHQRALYGPSYLSSIDSRVGNAAHAFPQGTSARKLHFAVFDALAPSKKTWYGTRSRKQKTVYVGQGSIAYNIIGKITPSGVISWMLGLRTGYDSFLLDPTFDEGTGGSSDIGWEKVADEP